MDVKNSKNKILTRRFSGLRKLESLNLDQKHKSKFTVRPCINHLSPRVTMKTGSRRGSDEKGEKTERSFRNQKLKEQKDFDDLNFEEEENFKEFLFYLRVTLDDTQDYIN